MPSVVLSSTLTQQGSLMGNQRSKSTATASASSLTAVWASLIMSIHRTVDGKRSLLDSFNRSMPIPSAADGCDFRLLLRGSMVEAYVNGVLVVPFALPNTVTRGGFQQCVTP